MEVLEAEQRVDVQAGDRVRVVVGDLLDVHPALRREHHERLLGRAVEDDRRVVLGGDVGGRLDPDLVDGEAADVHAEDRAGVLLGLAAVLGDLDAAGLAAAADQHLRLDHAGVADLVGGGDRLLDGGGGRAGGHRDAVAGEELLALVLEEVHAGRRTLEERPVTMHGRMPLPKEVTFVTFDVYGTLIDSDTGIYEAFSKEAEQDGYTISRDELVEPLQGDPEGDQGRLLRALRGGPAPHRRADLQAARLAARALALRASCPTRSSAGLRSRRPTRSSSASRRSSRSG